MKRLFLIFLLAVLPFQMSWATVSTYCQHEKGSAAQHFGHHEHQHQAGGEIQVNKSKSNGADLDCGHCHFSCATIASALESAAFAIEALRPVPYLIYSYRSHIPDGLARPDWRLAT